MISDNEIIARYYGQPPYYRNIHTGNIEKLPFRIRLPDGSTRTDPAQWSSDEDVLLQAGYIASPLIESDIAKYRPTLNDIKNQKLASLERAWNTWINNGWTTPEGWKLGLTIADVTLLSGAFLLLKESVNLGLSNTTTIIDLDNMPHTLDLTQMTSLLLNYGNHRATLSANYSNIKTQIQNANSIEEAESINTGE